MIDDVIPSWVEVRRGTTPLVLFAPHAGRRTAPRRPGRDNVNDLHTADITRDLGTRCDATWIINRERDRNDGDLNRVEQVQRGAPWLLDLVAEILEDMIVDCGRAVLLTIHGWNVIQAVCDVGVGLVENARGLCVPAARGQATVSPAFLESHLRPLQRRACADGIAVTIGARYPAAQPTNVLQLFTPARVDDVDPRLARLARLAPRVEAAQLELGIPLRWPGRMRDGFVAALSDVFAPAHATAGAAIGGATAGDAMPHGATPDARPEVPTSRAGAPAASRPRVAARLVCGGRPTTRIGLQLADGALAVLTSIDVAPSGAVAGRLLLTDAPDRLALFTGELTARGTADLRVPTLRIRSRAHHAFDVRFAGPLLSFPMLTPFEDLERGLAAGTLIDARVALRFTPDDGDAELQEGAARFGRAEGIVRLGTRVERLAATAYAIAGYAWPQRHPSTRVVLVGTPLGDVDLQSIASEDDTTTAAAVDLRFTLAGTARHDGAATLVDGSARVRLGDATATLHLANDTGVATEVSATLERVIPVRRPGRAGAVVETFYALLRIVGSPPGWIEVTVEHPPER